VAQKRCLSIQVIALLAAVPLRTTNAHADVNAVAAAEEQRFDVSEFRVLGNTTLSNVSIEKAVYPFLGTSRTFADVESARATLERSYHDAGYSTVVVDIPEQTVTDGVVRLRVTEGRLDQVRVTGARYFSNGRIRAALPALASGSVPALPEVQAQLAALNRATPDRVIVPVLRAGRTPGTVDVELKVSDELPLHGGLEFNDRYTADTSKLRLNASISYTNLFRRQHSLSLQYQTAPENTKDVKAIVGSYVFRAPAWENTTFALYAVDSRSDLAVLGTLAVIGNGNIYGFRAIRALPQHAGFVHQLTYGLDYKDFLENIRLADDQTLVTPIHYLNWSLAYTATLENERSTSSFNLAANFGVRGLVNDTREFADKRFKAQPNYFYLRGAAQRLQRLPWELQAVGRLSAQIAPDPLVSNEQFSIGGADTVRGYPESSQLGDFGWNATFELRSTSLSRALHLPHDTTYLLVFLDAGRVEIHDPLPSQVARVDLASWGLGVRAGAWHGFDLALDWAQALQDAGAIERGDQRTQFSFKYGF
jgi:hemolysin activation/secretion protein